MALYRIHRDDGNEPPDAERPDQVCAYFHGPSWEYASVEEQNRYFDEWRDGSVKEAQDEEYLSVQRVVNNECLASFCSLNLAWGLPTLSKYDTALGVSAKTMFMSLPSPP